MKVTSTIVPELDGLIVRPTGEVTHNSRYPDGSCDQHRCDVDIREGENGAILARYATAVYGVGAVPDVAAVDANGVSHDWWFLTKELSE